jgi:multiphosphoryl transfer protein
MVGLVVVSHSASLAEGVVELAREMGGEEVKVEAAGGMDDGSVGTDAALVHAAIERAMSDEGVLVLMDLGSALMSAEMATEMLEDGMRVLLSEAPLVEGAVAAAASAKGGASLEEVAGEARGALAMKSSQLGSGEQSAPAPAEEREPGREPDAEARVPVVNQIGLHARPAALVVKLAARFDADLRLAKAGGNGAPVNAKSLTALMTLGARLGDELVATASGPRAREALEALKELAREGFGEGVVAASATEGGGPPEPEPPPEVSPPQAGDVLSGIAASPGVAIAPAHRLDAGSGVPSEREAEDPETERRRLDEGRAAARKAIEEDRRRVAERGATAEAEIFAAHLALLDDEALLEPAAAAIDAGAAAEAAWLQAAADVAATYRDLDQPLLQERATDVEDVGRRVAAATAGEDPRSGPHEEAVALAAELTPAEAAALDPDVVRGVATARGTPTAHAAILARALGIPAVVGLGDALLAVSDGSLLLLDGDAGSLQMSPPDDVVREARERIEQGEKRRAAARERAREPAATRDGTRVEVAANVDSPAAAQAALELGAEGVGLLRTEFLFLEQPELPTEDEQAERIGAIARVLDGRPLIVRTLDAGADKPLPAVAMEPEANPFLGRRGIRLSLARPDLLATQLRAILRVAAEHPLKLMFPMVATAAELQRALAMLDRARADTGVDAELETGVMVEVPAAAILSERLARHVDFFSIGTNDLTQYVMAAERGNEHVAPLLAGPQPALLQLVRDTVAGAEEHGRWVGVCGELAGDPPAAVLLAGLGVRELSMAPPLIPEAKAALREVTLDEARAVAERALAAEDADEARRLAAELL